MSVMVRQRRKTVWRELADARERLGHNQIRAAELVGITQGSWSAIESGRKVPSRSLRKLLDLYIAGKILE